MKKHTKWISILLILTMSCLILTACPKNGSKDSQGAPAAVETEAESESADTIKTKDQNAEEKTESEDRQVSGETIEEIESAEIELESGEDSGGL